MSLFERLIEIKGTKRACFKLCQTYNFNLDQTDAPDNCIQNLHKIPSPSEDSLSEEMHLELRLRLEEELKNAQETTLAESCSPKRSLP